MRHCPYAILDCAALSPSSCLRLSNAPLFSRKSLEGFFEPANLRSRGTQILPGESPGFHPFGASSVIEKPPESRSSYPTHEALPATTHNADEQGSAHNVTPSTSAADPWLRYTLPSLAVAGGLGLLELARQRFQHGHMFSPTRYPEGIWDAEVHGLKTRDIFFESEDGTALHGWWMPHEEAKLTVVYCHGNSGNIAERVDVFQQLLRLKFNVFAFDYRGYGRSAGSPSESGVFADVRAALDYTAEFLAPWHETVLFGHSLGGAIAVDGALNRPEIAGLVVQSSLTQASDMARHFYPDLPVHLLSRNAFRSIEKVPRLTMPKLFIHGREDLTIPFVQGERLFGAAAEPKAFLPIARAGHNDVHLWGGLRYFSQLTTFGRQAGKHGGRQAGKYGGRQAGEHGEVSAPQSSPVKTPPDGTSV